MDTPGPQTPGEPHPRAAHSRATIAGRWGTAPKGLHYATDRFRTQRRRGRDPRLVLGLLERCAPGARFARALDAPCGTGRLTLPLAALAERLVALDVSAAMLCAPGATFGPQCGPQPGSQSGRMSGRMSGPVVAPVQRCQGSVFALPFADGAFDLTVACRLLHHFAAEADRRAALAELARVTRGLVVVSYWDRASWHAWRRRAPGPLRRRDTDHRVAIAAATLDAELAAVGLAPLVRAYSARFVSPQTFVLARKTAPPRGEVRA